jgi:hypothetical protein
MRFTINAVRLLCLAGLLAVLSVAVTQGGPQAATGVADIRVSFKLDPRITQGIHMGPRWVSPATYTRVDRAGGLTIEARAAGLDLRRKQVFIDPSWAVADPEVLTVTPAAGNAVRININKVGQSELVISADGVSKTMVVTCVQKDGSWRVDISQ